MIVPIRYTLLLLSLALPVQTLLAQEQFSSREAAFEALVDAVEDKDQARLVEILGPDYAKYQQGQESDPALSDLRTERFAAAIREFSSFYPIGEDRYTLADHDGDGVSEFAQNLVSSPGTRDGLYWEPEEGGDAAEESPLDPLKRLSEALLGEHVPGTPFLGYRFRMLSAQGPNAAADAYDYLINGHHLGGFAILAWPAAYGETGVMSFMVNQDRVIYENDLGEDTAERVEAIDTFDPGAGWKAVQDGELFDTNETL